MNSRILYGILLILIGSCTAAKTSSTKHRKYIFPKRHPDPAVVEAPKPEPVVVEEVAPVVVAPVAPKATGKWVLVSRPVYGRFGRFQGNQSVWQWQGPPQAASASCANGQCR